MKQRQSYMETMETMIPTGLNALDEQPRLLTREECLSIMDRVERLGRGGGGTAVTILGFWNGELRWARNRVSLASDRRDLIVAISRDVDGKVATMRTNQTDDVSLEAAVRAAERWAKLRRSVVPEPPTGDPPRVEPIHPAIWSDVTYGAQVESRAKLAQHLVEGAEEEQLLSAGYLEVRAQAIATASNMLLREEWLSTEAPLEHDAKLTARASYTTATQAQCSLTVRHPKGTGSGWAGLSGYDWAKIDGEVLAKQALDKCLASLNPVRIEPGRYTVILEPQAVCDLADFLVDPAGGIPPADRKANEAAQQIYVLGPDQALRLMRTKLGMKIIDERVTISHDPMDPQLGVYPDHLGMKPITWIENGVLKNLSHDRFYGITTLANQSTQYHRRSYRISGGTTPVSEMIATTKRGILVTRFSNLWLVDAGSLLTSGVTRDGLWLIENGKISKAIKNMRITESPLFVFNQIESMGVPVPIFRPYAFPLGAAVRSAIVPPIKANDFSFTSTIDAV